MTSVFQAKYDEFCADLLETCPELTDDIEYAQAIEPEDRIKKFQDEVASDSGNPNRDPKVCPGTVLPGVTLTPQIWSELSDGSKKAIQEYLTLLTMCSLMEGTKGIGDAQKKFFEGFLDQMKEKLKSADFSSLAGKFASFVEKFSTAGGGDGKGPKIPEKFLKGHIARLAEDLVSEFKAEDFGISEEDLLKCQSNPAKAFELLMSAYSGNPATLQNAMKKIAKKMQEKIQRGELKPEDLAAEAQEIMKESTDNPQFMEMMESIRNAFGFEDMDMARAQGREGSARLALVKNRMRAEIEKRKAAAAKAKTTTSAPSNVPDLTPEQLDALVNSIEQPTKTKANTNVNKNKGKGKK
jgi:hypothetical protein